MASSDVESFKRIAVVTGANQGIGKEIARALGKTPGVHVIATSRDASKGDAVQAELRSDGADVTFFTLDITSSTSIEKFVGDYKAAVGDVLDILINNAGIAFKGDAFGPEEARTTMATNFYGTHNFTEAMLPLLRNSKSSSHARIVNVCSMAGRLNQVSSALQAKFQDPEATFESLQTLIESFISSIADGTYAEKGWPKSMYGVSKLAEIAYTYVLARQLLREDIVVDACCPGYCATNMSSFKGPRSAEKGAETPVWLALREGSVSELTGGFFQDKALISW